MPPKTTSKIADLLTQEYDLSNWQDIYADMFPGSKLLKKPVCFEANLEFIQSSSEVGSVEFDDGMLLFFDIEVKAKTNLRRNRVALNNSLARWITRRGADAAIGVFHSKNQKAYRFTFIRKTFYYGEDGEVNEKRTNAKRYTYILGPESHCRTATQRFEKLFRASHVTLDKVEEAFSVEILTKQFYKELFEWYKWASSDKINVYYPNLDTASNKNRALQEHLIRLITRLIFVWFIKQKGLVPEELFKPEEIARRLKNFKPQDLKQDTYYKCYLQNLFFATLNREIGERAFAEPAGTPNQYLKARANDYGVSTLYRHLEMFKCDENAILEMFEKIPYLNGGLFECLDKKDEIENTPVVYVDGFSRTKKNSASLPNALFFDENRGIIPLLERYNFTVEENTPLDQTVALDPELLGKVFENLLGVYNPETHKLARKQSGSFYTPREIVDYMIDEALIAYLKTNTSYEKKLLESLVRDDELPKQLEEDNQTRKELSQQLRNIKILDPACGSGAFPVGALNRIMTLLRKLSKGQLNEYKTKMHLIENCLYGVDIQNIAVQISKLRFFISLICEQEPDLSDIGNNYGIKPLPNLETRFVAADTLIKLNDGSGFIDFEGIKEIRQKLFEISQKLICPKNRDEKARLQKEEKSLRSKAKDKLLISASKPNLERIKDLEKEKACYQKQLEDLDKPKTSIDLFGNTVTNKEADNTKKDRKELRAKIKKCDVEIKREWNKGKNNDEATRMAEKLFSWNSFELNKTADYFEPEWMFAIKDGFDIVIGNPPYIQLQYFEKKDIYKNERFRTFAGTGDIYCLFYERGWQLLKENGHLCFITSNKWMRSDYGKLLREFLANKTNPELLIDFGPLKIFESATVDTNILLFAKSEDNKGKTNSCMAMVSCRNDLSGFFKQHAMPRSFKTSDSWVLMNPIEESINQKIEAVGIQLKDWGIRINYGIKTGCIEAFIINETKKEELIAEDPKSAEIIRPVLRGEDIKRYGYDWAYHYLIATVPARHCDIEKFPAVKRYLLSFDKERLLSAGYDDVAMNSKLLGEFCRQRLEQSGKIIVVKGRKIIIGGKTQKARKKTGNKWFETQDQISYWEDFSKPKIVWAETMRIKRKNDEYFPRFSYIEDYLFTNNSCFIATGKNIKYILVFLNSLIGRYQLSKKVPILDDGGYLIRKTYIKQFRVPKGGSEFQKAIDSLFNEITKKGITPSQQDAIEEKINEMTFKAFNINNEEQEYIREVVGQRLGARSF